MLFDMDTLKRRGSKSTVPQFFVTMPPDETKRTKAMSRQRRIKVAIMGKSGVGKSALVVRYLTKRYIGEYSCLETHASTEVEIDDERVMVEICDTCKNTEEQIVEHIHWADGFILVFSITDYWSLYEVARLTSIIKHTKNEEKIPIVVLCNQTDKEQQRRISRTEAGQFLSDLGKPVFKTSAANNYDSVRNAFEKASRMIYKWKFPEGRPRGRSGSIMDPLREAFTRLHSSNEEDLKRKQRPASTADLDVRRVYASADVGEAKQLTSTTGNNGGKIILNNNFLGVPSRPEGRNRSQSFA